MPEPELDMDIELNRRHNCPICESKELETVFKLPYSDQRLSDFIEEFYQGRVDLTVLADATYQVDKCSHCDSLFQSYVLNEAGQAALYGDWVDNQASLLKKQRAKSKLFRQYAAQLETVGRMIAKPPYQINVLEFGAGWGYWSRMAQAFGFSVQSLELSPDRVDYARQMGVDVIQALPDAGSHYDLIYANQVFEHLEQPLQTLRQLVSRLKPGGLVYLRVPDGRGVERQLRHHGWTQELDAIHPLEHINCFTRKSLISLAVNAGLKPVQPPLRLDMTRLWRGLKREINDRWLTTHIFFKKA